MGCFNGVLDGVDYHQFYLVADDDQVSVDYADDSEIAPHGLIAPSGHGVCVSTGIAIGAIHLGIDVLDGPPGAAIDERHPWAAVTEVSFEAVSHLAGVRLLMTNANPPFSDLIVLPDGAGWYRVRAHALGRELDYDDAVREPRERHLLQLWRTDGPLPVVHFRVDDQWANQDAVD